MFPKVELEVGKWYKSTTLSNVFLFLKDKEYGRYGFDSNGWYNVTDSNFELEPDKWTLATKEEVETALIAEAKKRGFKEGVYFNSVVLS